MSANPKSKIQNLKSLDPAERADQGGPGDSMRAGTRQKATGHSKSKPKKKSVFLAALCATLFAFCASASSQQAKKIPRIGVFLPVSASAGAHLLEAFRQGLYEHGYVVGQNITLEPRYAEGKPERLSGLAAEIVHLKVEVIVAGSTPGIMAAKSATEATPIVMVTTGDPVASRLVASLARPGGNITGLTALG